MRKIDKNFCLSSYIAFRYIFKDDIDFYEGVIHENFKLLSAEEKKLVSNAKEIDYAIRENINDILDKFKNVGILLSGGMDSAILASYLPAGSHAYSFCAKNTEIYNQDIYRASYYCKKNGLIHHKVEIEFEDYQKFTPTVMQRKGAPVHSIEPQIYKAAKQAQEDGVEIMIEGDGADYVFGGMDQLLSIDWEYDAFIKRYISLEPKLVLNKAVNIEDAFLPYKKGKKIDYLSFMNCLTTIESYGSYDNAFKAAGLEYLDPYQKLQMRDTLDLKRIRNGESKYLIRDLYRVKYPELEVPEKIPMPRPVDMIFEKWTGPTRSEFRNDISMGGLSGNQKWQLWCAELFLNMYEPINHCN